MKFTKDKRRPARSMNLKQFMQKGLNITAFTAVIQCRGRCIVECPYLWIDWSTAVYAVDSTLKGLLDPQTKLYMPLLNRVLHPSARFSLACRVATIYVSNITHATGRQLLRTKGFLRSALLSAKPEAHNKSEDANGEGVAHDQQAARSGEDSVSDHVQSQSGMPNPEEADATPDQRDQGQSQPSKLEEDAEEEYFEVESLTEYSEFDGADYYFVSWKDSSEGTWEPDKNLCCEAFDELKAQLKSKFKKRKLEANYLRRIEELKNIFTEHSDIEQ